VIDADRQASSAEWFDAMPLDEVELVEAPPSGPSPAWPPWGIAVVDTPPGDERIVRAAIAAADAVVIRRAQVGGDLEGGGNPRDDPSATPLGGVCAARLGTNDLTETIQM